MARINPERSIPVSRSFPAKSSMTSSFLLTSPGLREKTGTFGNLFPYSRFTLLSVIITVQEAVLKLFPISHQPVFPI